MILAAYCSNPSTDREIQLLEHAEEVHISSLYHHRTDQETALLLFRSKQDSSKQLLMKIGSEEARYLSLRIQKWKPDVPLAIDVLLESIQKTGFQIREILIDSLIKGVYSSKIICTTSSQTVILHARPSDATSLAVMTSCPIYVDTALLKGD
jgi:hypothetical protein